MTEQDRDILTRRGTGRHEGEFFRIHAPYRNAEICLIEKPDDAVSLMELRIREGRRITLVDLDRGSVEKLARAMLDWVAPSAGSGNDDNGREYGEHSVRVEKQAGSRLDDKTKNGEG